MDVQLDVQQELDRVRAEIQATKEKLTAAEHAGDGANVNFLLRDMSSLREQQTLLLRAQVSSQ